MVHLKNNRYICLFIFLALLTVFCSLMSFAQRESDGSQKPVTNSTTGGTKVTTTQMTTTTSNPKPDDDKPVIVIPKNITVCIDAGHGWADNGASSYVTDENGSPFFEKNINLAISKQLRDKLEAMGYTVVMIRESDDQISPAGIASDNICNIDRRVDWVNSQSDIGLMISIHCDSFTNTAVSGTRIYYHTVRHKDIHILGSSIKDSLIDGQLALNTPLLYDKSNKLWSLTASNVPAILVECGFITNESDLTLLTDADYQKEFGESLAFAIDEYFTQIKGQSSEA